jgi:hypothetical protein
MSMRGSQQGAVSRARWAAIGAAVAVSLGVGGVAVTNAVVSTGERTAFIPITPCRLFDTRPAPSQVGPRATPLGAHEVYTVQVTGTTGNCTIPSDASAVAMNVTAIGGNAASFLTVWPSDVVQPLASNLNWVPGSPPTPNKVDVKLSAAGAISLYNDVGTVSVVADVVGYYADHNHDDRYYTQTQSDAQLATKVNASDVYTKAQINGLPSSSVVAGGAVNADGTISTSFSRFGSAWTITKSASAGFYLLRLPGLNPGCLNPAVPLLLVSGFDAGAGVAGYGGSATTVCGSGDTSLSIVTRDVSNALADRGFQFIAYRPGNTQILPASAHAGATECTVHSDGTIDCV